MVIPGGRFTTDQKINAFDAYRNASRFEFCVRSKFYQHVTGADVVPVLHFSSSFSSNPPSSELGKGAQYEIEAASQ